MLAVAGCSSHSDSKSDAAPSVPSARPSALLAPVKFTELPGACGTIGARTIGALVPAAKSKGGTEGKSSDIADRGSCSWNGLDDNGIKGSQYRWLDVSLMRYDSDATLGSGAKRAGEYYTKEVNTAQGTDGAKNIKASPSSGIGDQSTTVTYTLEKTGVDFAYATVVARTQNVVLTLNYNGAGYAGAKSPDSAELLKNAVTAAQEAVASIGGSGAKAPAAQGTPTPGQTAKAG
jgi:hypothetical protein